MEHRRTLSAIIARANKLGIRSDCWFSSEEDQFLKDNYSKLSIAELSLKLNRPEVSVTNRLILLNLYNHKSKHIKWTEHENDLIRKYFPTEGNKMYVKLSDRTAGSVEAQARKLGLCLDEKYKQKSRQWTEDEDNIIKQFYPTEGTAVALRLDGCKKWEAQDRARKLGVKAIKVNGAPKKVICIESGVIYQSANEAMKQLKLGGIDAVCRAGKGTIGGYHWKYVEDNS